MNSDFTEHTWTPPVYNTSKAPSQAHCSALIPDPTFVQNFVRSAKWAPDGSVALAHCENRSFQYLDLPQELLQLTLAKAGADQYASPSKKFFPQATSIVDFAWYPRATIHDPASFCFVSSVREAPVQLLDASDGRLRASYRIMDHRERQIAPHSLAFNGSADKLYCGFEDAIEVFDLNAPGEGTRLATTPSRKSRDGLKGIISALAFCPSYDAAYSMYAAGSLLPSSSSSPNIALYSEDTGEKAMGWIGQVRASVMQLAFNPTKPHVLYSSFRRHDTIYAWDLRGDTSVPVQLLQRQDGGRMETNQKIKFDVDISGKWLGAGDESGNIHLFDLAEPTTEDAMQGQPATRPTLSYHAHDDAVGSVSFHPLKPLLLSVSGSRHFDIGGSTRGEPSDDTDDSSFSDEDREQNTEIRTVKRHRYRPQPSIRDSSVKLWDFGSGP